MKKRILQQNKIQIGRNSSDRVEEYCQAVVEGPFFYLKESHIVMAENVGKRRNLIAQLLAAKILCSKISLVNFLLRHFRI